ncbi:MAG TPA: tetratricopeptide repeat protein, partial [Balneolaceae bacterium]|nr:tetratricopeptide repeat protein [Balneolaceae bacterium]
MFKKLPYIILPFFFLFLPVYCFSQSEADSLRHKLKFTHGLERAQLLIQLSEHTRQTNIQQAIKQAKEAHDIARQLGNDKLQSRSQLKLGFYYSLQKKNGKALTYYLSALEIVREHGYRIAEADVLFDLGRFYAGQDNYSKALEYYFKSMRIKESAGDKKGSAAALRYIGGVYSERGDPGEALSFYKRAYNLSRQTADYTEMSMAASEIAIIYQNRDSLQIALSYYEKAMDAAKTIHSSHAQATILLHMSSVYRDQKLFQIALDLNRRQIRLAQIHQSTFLEAQGYENLADLYHDQDSLEQSNRYYRQAKLLYDRTGLSKQGLSNKLARNYLKQGRIARAIFTIHAALTAARNTDLLTNRQTSLQLLVQAYADQGDFQDALKAQTKLMAIKDSLFNKEKARQIAQMQSRYKVQEKENQIDLLQKKRKKASLIRDVFAGGLVLVIIIGILIYNRQQLKIKKNETELENNHLKEEQLKQDILFKNKQLTTHSLNLVQKNEVMKELKKSIQKIRTEARGDIRKKLGELDHLVDYSFNLDEDWKEFKLYFEEVHTGFFDILKKRYPALTPNELRLSALIKLNLTIKEIAAIMGISPDSIKTARYRLRK